MKDINTFVQQFKCELGHQLQIKEVLLICSLYLYGLIHSLLIHQYAFYNSSYFAKLFVLIEKAP